MRGNEKDDDDDDDALGRHVAEEEEEEEDYFRVECEDEIIAEMTTERGGRLPRLEDIVEALEKKVTEKEKKDASGGGCG